MKFSKTLISLSISGLFFATSAIAQAQDTNATVRIGQKSKTTNQVVDESAVKTDVVATDKKAKYQSKQTQDDLKAEYQASVSVSAKASDKKRGEKHFEKSAGHLYIYDAAVLLKSDLDGDGYYSEIRVDFDVDASYDAYYDVYAELYIREQGTSDWVHYYTTDVFEIYGDESSDDYHVTTSFNDGFPPANYEIAIDLYEYGYSGVVDYLEAADDPDLGNLPIEDVSYEQSQPQTDVSISTVKTEIFTDNDGDGFYRDFKISFDADVASGQRSVIAKLYQKTGSGSWQYETESDIYTLDGTSTADTIAFEAEWQSGYATSYYDFKIELYDSATNEFLAEASHEFGPLVDVPLEDAGKDTTSGGSGSGSGSGSSGNPSTTSSGSGGGSWNLLGLMLLGLAGFIRKRQKT
ncbi:MAG: hypothetical protein HWE16_17830 [Gammaproteobacteria bacterium]|nr:hypothetical protein [Gammaproteobacteria bacterium]